MIAASRRLPFCVKRLPRVASLSAILDDSLSAFPVISVAPALFTRRISYVHDVRTFAGGGVGFSKSEENEPDFFFVAYDEIIAHSFFACELFRWNSVERCRNKNQEVPLS